MPSLETIIFVKLSISLLAAAPVKVENHDNDGNEDDDGI